MTMPRPSGRAQRIAEKVIPGLRNGTKSRRGGSVSRGSMSEVEVKETEHIENKKGIRKNEKTKI